MGGPCRDYVDVEDIEDDVCGITDPVVIEGLIHEASEVVYALSGRQFPGLCPTKVRPCRDTCWECPCPCGCNCLTDAVILPINTISVDGVTIDGTPLDPSEWAVIGYDHLVRTDGRNWPSRNVTAWPDTEPGTWSIDLTVGSHVPEAIRHATIDLVTELALEKQANPACRLPSSTTSINRQGLSVSLDQRVQQVREMGSLLPSIGMIVGTYNPENQRLPSDVLNPDTGWILYRSSADAALLRATTSDLTVTATVSGSNPTQATDVDWGDASQVGLTSAHLDWGDT